VIVAGYVAPHKFAAPSIGGRERYRLPKQYGGGPTEQARNGFFYQQIFHDQTNSKHASRFRTAPAFLMWARTRILYLVCPTDLAGRAASMLSSRYAIFEALQVTLRFMAVMSNFFNVGWAEASKDVELLFYQTQPVSQSYGDETDERESVAFDHCLRESRRLTGG